MVAGGQPVPQQRVPHVLLHLHGRLLEAGLEAKAASDPDGLELGSEHLDLADLLQLRQVVEVDGG